MDSEISRKEFFRRLGLSSLAAVASPAFAQQGVAVGSSSAHETSALPHPEFMTTVKDYGAKGDGVTDDTASIQRALRSNALIFFPAGNYLVSGTIQLHSLQNVHIWATGATLTNNTLTNHFFQIDQCQFVTIVGGKYTRLSTTVPASWPTDRHCFYFTNCRDVTVRDVFIDGSPGMGIAVTNSTNAKILDNTIKNTTRDGIYSHYAINVIYSGNYLENITDDALSMHDYGVNSAKPNLMAMGYAQAGYSIITNNKIKSAARGIASIGLQSLTVTGNIVENVADCGIEVYNSAESFEGPDTRVQDVIIADNLIFNACLQSIDILGKKMGNRNQGGGGKAALTVGSFDVRHQYQIAAKRLSNISVTGNMVNFSAADAYFLNNIDGLIFSNNSARNCNTSPFPPYTGYIVECWSCTDLCGFNNNVVDTGSPATAIAAYRVRDTAGSIGGWLGPGYSVYPGSKKEPKVLY